MRTNNKQATKANNSNLSALDISLIIGTIVLSMIIIIFAPGIAEALAKFLGVLICVGMLVGTTLYALLYHPTNENSDETL